MVSVVQKLKFNPSRTVVDKQAAKVVRKFYADARARVLSARRQSPGATISPKDDYPDGNTECLWVRIVDRCRGKVNPLWAIDTDFLSSLTENRDIAASAVASAKKFPWYQNEGAELCRLHCDRAESSVRLLAEQFAMSSVFLGTDDPESVIELLKGRSRVDAVIECYTRSLLGVAVSSDLWKQAAVDYAYCPTAYLELSADWLKSKGLVQIFEVSHGMDWGRPVRISWLHSTFGGSLSGDTGSSRSEAS